MSLKGRGRIEGCGRMLRREKDFRIRPEVLLPVWPEKKDLFLCR